MPPTPFNTFNFSGLLESLETNSEAFITVTFNGSGQSETFLRDLDHTTVGDLLASITGSLNYGSYQLEFTDGWILEPPDYSLRRVGVKPNDQLILFNLRP